jgi:hypothetical protein
MLAPESGTGLDARVSQENIPVLVPLLGAFCGFGDRFQDRFLDLRLLQNTFQRAAIVVMLADHRFNKVLDLRIVDANRLCGRTTEKK